VVDRLLASPQDGERWGRHWLDIWRYSDPFGLGEEYRYLQRHIWCWRDWIVESLNADKGHAVLNRQGAILYRAGHYKEAVARLNEGVALDKGEASMQDFLFLAMAQHRLGETGEARKTLTRFVPPRPDQGQPWENLELELLGQEARALIEGK